MSDFWIYFQAAWKLVLDIKGYNHTLFLVALIAPYAFKDWKSILVLMTTFAIGETIAMILSVVEVLSVTANLNKFMIPATLLITAFFNIFTISKSQKTNTINWIALVVLCFGIIHGLLFSNFFKSLVIGKLSDKILPLFEFSVGVQAAQLLLVVLILIFSYVIQHFFKFSKRDFTLTFSSFVIGVALPVVLKNILLK
jgi:hypothetical protein